MYIYKFHVEKNNFFIRSIIGKEINNLNDFETKNSKTIFLFLV